MEPTRADIRAKVAWVGRWEEEEEAREVDFRGRNGERCFMSSKGPRVLTLNVWSAVS